MKMTKEEFERFSVEERHILEVALYALLTHDADGYRMRGKVYNKREVVDGLYKILYGEE